MIKNKYLVKGLVKKELSSPRYTTNTKWSAAQSHPAPQAKQTVAFGKRLPGAATWLWSSCRDLRPQPREVTATAVLLPSPPPYPCSPTQGAAPRDAAQGCSYSSRLLFSWPLLLCMAKIICTHTTKLPAAYSGGKKREALCTLIYTLSK